MPSAALYVILAVIVAPSLVTLGLPPLAVHLFIFYMGTSSFISPPVALGAFAAGAIAKADPMIVGLYACRLGVVIFIVPFIFIYSPALLLMGSIQEIVIVVAQSLVGLAVIAAALSGFLFRKLNWGKRILLTIGGFALLIPLRAGVPHVVLLNIAGGAVSILVILWEWLRHSRTALAVQPVPES